MCGIPKAQGGALMRTGFVPGRIGGMKLIGNRKVAVELPVDAGCCGDGAARVRFVRSEAG